MSALATLTRTAARTIRSGLRRFARTENGTSAVEFALIAPVFLVLIFAIIETGVIYMDQAVLQNAVNDAARQVRTGQVQSNGLTQAQFNQIICNDITGLMSCGSSLQIDMESYSSFTGASYASPFNADGTLNTNLNNFQPGVADQVVLLRAMYTWQVFTPLLTPFLSNMPGNNRLIVATAAFRNEAF